MKSIIIINNILNSMLKELDTNQLELLKKTLINELDEYDIIERASECNNDNSELISKFINAKRIEGCSSKTLNYYNNTLISMLSEINKNIKHIDTEDLRAYLIQLQGDNKLSKITIDNVRRILSSFFSWLEDEDIILKSPVRRIHKVKIDKNIKDVYSDESLEIMRDNIDNDRDLALIDILASTGMRVGELVLLNKNDINFNERECIVFGKGNKERIVYFDARTKIHLMNYIDRRLLDISLVVQGIANSPASLFVSIKKPYSRLTIAGVESRLRTIGNRLKIKKVHPHKFRRTLATNAIDKGMPIEQLQKLLGHQRIDTTLQYAMVRQNNVKLAHKKFIG